MFGNLSEAVSGVLLFRFLASDPTISHPSYMSCRLIPHSCACPHPARYVATARWQGVHRLGLGFPFGLAVTVAARSRWHGSQHPGRGDSFSGAWPTPGTALSVLVELSGLGLVEAALSRL